MTQCGRPISRSMTGKEEKDILHVHVGRERTKTSKGACGQRCYICDCLTFISWGKSTLILMLSKYWKFPIALLFYFIWLGSWQNVTGIYESKLFLLGGGICCTLKNIFRKKERVYVWSHENNFKSVLSCQYIYRKKNKIIKKKCNSLCFNSVRFISSGRNGFIFIESKLITSTTKHGTRTFSSRLRRKIVLRFGLIGNCRHASLN